MDYTPFLEALHSVYPVQGLTQLVNQEGLETQAYTDSLGNWTIGVGHTPASPGEVWTVEQALSTLVEDVELKGAHPVNRNFPWSISLGTVRWWVLVNMSFNMGIGSLLQFSDTLSNIENSNWLGALHGMQESLWYQQVPNRAKALQYQLYFNQWVPGYLDPEMEAKLSGILA